ncbi:hypothetical protein CI610_01064 [invertebrate metagenome]|uniref:Uncharacterized protein n=1 Tax=invertebrate metagenome TaxID=1711999 RepID=A0A2H9T9Y6_9ZZZZ
MQNRGIPACSYFIIIFFILSSSVCIAGNTELRDAIEKSHLKFQFPEGHNSGLLMNLVKKCNNKIDLRKDVLLFIYCLSPEQVFDELMKESGYIEVDCQLFVQVACLLLSDDFKTPGFTLLKGVISVDEVYHCDREVAFLVPENQEVFDFLSSENGVWFISKTNWVIRDGDKWLGIVNSGVKSGIFKAWARMTKNQLRNEVDDIHRVHGKGMKDNGDVIEGEAGRLGCMANVLDCHFKMKHCDKWKIISNKGREEKVTIESKQ